jgi:membrane protein
MIGISHPQASAGETGGLNSRARAWARALLDGFKEHDLLTYASAISFQILTAVIPFLLFILALASIFHLTDVWRDHVEPQIQSHVSPAVFTVIKSAVANVFTGRRALWATVGGLLALWQISGAVRAVMGALARIYCAPRERPFIRRYTISFVLSIEVAACFVLVALCVLFAPFIPMAHAGAALNAVAFLVRWTLVSVLLGLVVALLVRHAPSTAQTVPWVTLGATLVIVSWLIVSLLFRFYLTDIASYDSVFGNLAVVIVAMAYLYISTTMFLFGAQLDAIIRLRATGIPSGHDPE